MSDEERPDRSKRKRTRLRRLVRGVVYSLLILAVLLGTAWWWLESDAAGERLRLWIQERASQALQRRVSISSLELDLFPFHVSLDGVEVAGAPDEDVPFLTIDQTDIHVSPWPLVTGRLEVASVELYRPTLHVDLDEDGTTNLPRLVREEDGDGWEVDVRYVEVEGGTVELNHRPAAIDAVASDLAVEVRPTAAGGRSGSIRFTGGNLVVEPGGQPIDLSPVSLRLSFETDPREVHVDDVLLRVAASEVRGSGTIDRWDAVHLDLEAGIDVVDIARVIEIPGPDVNSGTVRLDGDLDYDDAGLRLQGTIVGDRLVVGGVELQEPSARLEVDAGLARLEEIETGFFDGRLEGEVGVDLASDPRAWSVSYRAVDVDLARLTAGPGLPGIRFAGRGDARGELRWAGSFRETVDGEGEVELHVPDLTMAEVFPVGDAPRATGPRPGGGPPATAPGAPPGQAAPDRPVPSLPLPLTASAVYLFDDGVLTLRRSRATLPRTELRLEGEIGVEGRVDAALRVTSDDLRILAHLFDQVQRFRGAQPASRAPGLRGAGALDLRVSGRLPDGPRLQGTMSATALRVYGNPVGDVEGRVRLAGDSLHLEGLRIRRGTGSARVEATFRTAATPGGEEDYRIDAELDGYPLEIDRSLWERGAVAGLPTGLAFESEGPIDGEVRLSGRYGESPVGRIEVATRGVELDGVGPFRARLQVRLTRDAWYADRVELEGEAGTIDLTGSWSRRDDTISARLDARGLDVAALGELLDRRLPLAGRLQAEVRISGTPEAPEATLRGGWEAARFQGVAVGDVGAAARLHDGRVALLLVGGSAGAPTPEPPEPPRVSASGAPPALPDAPARGWAATAAVSAGTRPVLRFRATGSARWVPPLLAARGTQLPEDLSVDGVVDARGSIPLDDWQAGRVRATVADLRLELGDVRLEAPPPVVMELRDGFLEVEVPTLLSRDGSFSAHATVDLRRRRWVEAEASGHLEMEVLRLLWPELVTTGHLDGTVSASGPLDDTELEGRIELEGISVEHPSWPYPAEGVSGAIGLAGDRLELVDVRGSSAGQEFTVSGVLPLRALAGDPGEAPVELELAVAELPLAPVLERSAALGTILSGGDVTLRTRISGRGLDWRAYTGEVTLQGLRVRVADLPLRLAEETTVDLREGGLELSRPLRISGPGTEVEVDGTVATTPLSLDLRVRGTLSLDPLNAFVEEWGVAGQAEVDLAIAGRPPDLGYDGTVRVRNGLVSPPPIGQPVESIQARFELDGRDVRVVDFQGRFGGGVVTADGSLQLRDSVPWSFNLALSVEDALLRLEQEVRLTVSADLVHEGTRERSVLSGSIFVDQGQYRRRWEPGDPLLEILEDSGGDTDSPFERSVNLDLTLEASRNLRVDNNIADLELQADLQVRGTLADPVLLGRASVIEGDVTWQDNTFRILQGTVEFQNPVRTEPTFDVRAETTIREYIVTLNLSGSLDSQIQLNYSSSPPLSDLEFWRLLALGQTPQSGTPDDDINLGAVGLQASNFLTAQYLNEVSRGAQQVFGVDRFRIEPTIFGSSADPTARVSVGEQVTRNLFVNYSTVLGQGDEQLITVEYQLTRGIRIIGTREEDGSVGIDFHFDHRF